MLVLILLELFILYFFINSIYLWIKKDFRNDYYYLMLYCSFQFFNLLFYKYGLLLFELFVNFLSYYLLVSAAIIPFYRFYKASNKQYYDILRIFNPILTVIYFISVCLVISISLITKNDSIVQLISFFNFLYTFITTSFVIYILLKSKEFSYKVLLKNWLSYICVTSFTELTNFLFTYNGFWNYVLIIPIILLFIATRGSFKNDKFNK